ncbi:hypothetical protein DSO57_1009747 [Entomophthora muscae]|uniref:Uncharacterized protein n=1 Tax=Entomophthora muscae TaxID=34485 RepID=A0ACC2USC5_9FUNG|nr:hypothetical protein DSO57_1009747 [Entomophthora muscae]
MASWWLVSPGWEPDFVSLAPLSYTATEQMPTANVQKSAAIKQIHTATMWKPATTKLLPTVNAQAPAATKQIHATTM